MSLAMPVLDLSRHFSNVPCINNRNASAMVVRHTHKLVLYLAHEHTRGLEGQPPVQYEHEVVTGDGDVDTLLQATP